MIRTVKSKGRSLRGLLLCAIAAWIVISTGDRIVWANAHGGLLGYIGSEFRGVVLEGCEGRGIEYKASNEAGVLQYRCNTIGDGPAMLWPFRYSGKSATLAATIVNLH